MKLRQLFFLAALLFSPTIAFAGGSHFEAEILNFVATKKGEYRMTLMQFDESYGSEAIPPKKLIINLRYNWKALLTCRDPALSKGAYLKSIEVLQEQFRRGGRFKFGVMSEGFEKMKGKQDEFQSNALAYLKEPYGGLVVYSFPRCL